MDVDDGRHFRNHCLDTSEPPDCKTVLGNALKAVLPQACKARHKKPSVYTGEGGVAFALLHLVRRGLHPRPEEALLDVRQRLEAGEPAFDARRVTLLEGLPGNIALQACCCLYSRRRGEADSHVQRLGQLAERVRSLEEGECEVLYGRCGFLGAVLLLRQQFGDAALLREVTTPLVKQVLTAGRRAGDRRWPLYYEWHEKCYLGGAHGIAGILLTLLQLPEELAAAEPEALPLIRDAAEQLLDQRFRSGNMPSSLGNTRDKCVHWCHGAPGIIPLLIKMAEVFREDRDRYLTIALEMGEVVWRRGLLSTKGLGLCHGTPGNGYTLLALHRATGDALWLRRAQHFAVFAAENANELAPNADRPYSLFEGVAGALTFWADCLHATATGSSADVFFPCYEFM